jgi:hypothetical protein
MPIDIRRMTREELDELNRAAQEWRVKQAAQQGKVSKSEEPTQVASTPVQMDLWATEKYP